MSVTKIIAVVGATGATAGGLARAILSDPDGGYACRAITRDPGSAAARALSEQGATVVKADLDDYDSLVRAFDGAYGAFCMTNFFVTFSAEQETQQAANQARAAAAAGVRHAIWSTAEDTRRWYPLDDDTDADAARRLQGAELGRQGRGRPVLRRVRGPHHLPVDAVPLGGVRLRARRAATGPGRCAHPRHAARRGAAAGHRRRGHRPLRLRDLPGPGTVRRRDGRHRRRAHDRRPAGRGAVGGVRRTGALPARAG